MSRCRWIHLSSVVTIWLTLSGSVAVVAGEGFPPGWRFPAGADPVASRGGMVVTADSLASGVGAEILRTGGNAIDAAVAVGFALAVTFPEAGNLGGGGFLVVRLADGTAATLDFRETAPAAATRDMYLDGEGNPTDRSLYGPLAAGVPGTVMGMWQLHQRFGSLPWFDLLARAIRLAGEGYAIRPPHHDAFEDLALRLESFDGDLASTLAATAETYLPGGAAPEVGALFLQPDLAGTLRRIAATGAEGFYAGETAERLVEEMARDGGILTRDDLRGYRAVWREPVTFPYRDHTIVTMPPASSGGVTMAEIANILAGYDLSVLGYGSAQRIHLFVEAARRAYSDRNQYLGDSDFVEVPLSRLISTEYADQRGKSIRLDAATPSAEVGPGLEPVDRNGETTHYSIVDAEGNAVSVTTTINTSFGSLVTVRGAGFLLNNEMDDFTSLPGRPNYYGLVQGEVNAIQPGKRMLSSMTPTIVLDPQNRLLLVTGTPGGSTIITTVFQTISNVIDSGMNIADAICAPRVHHQHLPDAIQYEVGGLSLPAFADLERLGHSFTPVRALGNVQAILLLPDGTRTGMADPRGAGMAIGTPE